MTLSLPRLAAVPLLLLGACASPESNIAQVAPAALTGISRDALLSCAGVPDRSRSEGTREYFTYEAGEFVSYPSASLGFGGIHDRFGFGIGVPLADSDVVRNDYCEATFVIDNGVVSQLNYTSSSGIGSTRYRQCGRIVQNCMAMVDPGALQRAYGS